MATPSAVPKLTPMPVIGERTSISAPRIMETTPPTPSTPCVGNLASSTNNPSASTISRSPVKFTGSRCIAKSASKMRDSANHARREHARMRELRVEPQHADNQQNEENVRLHDAREKLLAAGHFTTCTITGCESASCMVDAIEARDRAAIELRDSNCSGEEAINIDQLAVERFLLAERFRVGHRRRRQLHIASALAHVAAQVRVASLRIFLRERFVNLHRLPRQLP